MELILTINVPNADSINDIEGLLEELELDIIDKIQCGKTKGTAGHRCSPNYPKGTWEIKGLPIDWGEEN
jgi:hypothetical protein